MSTLFAVLLAVALPSPILAQAAPQQTQDRAAESAALKAAVEIPDSAQRAKALRGFLADHPTGEFASAAQVMLALALLQADAPSKEIVTEARLALTHLPKGDQQLLEYRVDLASAVAVTLIDREEMLDVAIEFATIASDSLPTSREAEPLRNAFQLMVGTALGLQGKGAEAIGVLQKVVASDPDNQQALLTLGAEMKKAERQDDAIDAYVRAESVFDGEQIDGTTLRALYRTKHGSLDGLDARLASAREASVRRVALDRHRVDLAAPTWELQDLAGTTVKLGDLSGQVVVLDFWATWCPPCRKELPHLQELHTAYAGKDVKIIGINNEGAPDRTSWNRVVDGFVKKLGLGFPILNDYDGAVNTAYDVEALPTVVVIDRTGRIRYRIVGYSPAVKEIVRAQIDSLLAAP